VCAYVNAVGSALGGDRPALPLTAAAASAALALPALLACLARPRGSASTQVSATPSRMHRWQGRASSQTVLHTLHRAQTRFALGRRIATDATTVGGWAAG